MRSSKTKNNSLQFLALLISIYTFTLTGSAVAQSASDYFQQGLNTSSIDRKIAAFEKVIELNPGYVEAYFYLGLAYKSKGNYSQAEIMLNKAYFTNPYGLNNEIKMRILFELGTVHALLDRPEEARDALRGAKDLAKGNNVMLGRISYELGQIYLKQGNHQLALQELREGKALLPQNGALFDKSIKAANDNIQGLATKYADAQSFLNRRRYDEAIQILNDIIQIEPNYKEAGELLRRAQGAAQSAAQDRNLAALYDRAVQAEKTGTTAAAIRLHTEIQNIDPNYRDVKQRLVRLNRKPAPQSTRPNIENIYRAGIAALRKKQWRQALEQFGTVQRLEPGYENVSGFIRQANRELQQFQQLESEKQGLYGQAMSHTEEKKWRDALQAFRKLQTLDPGYRDIQQQLARIRDAIAQQNTAQTTIDTLYKNGVLALENGDWLDAVLAFEKVSMLDPGHADVANKLADAQFNLQRRGTVYGNNKKSTNYPALLWIGSGLSVLMLPIIGALVFSPTLRARLYLLQGNYLKAADIYETLLQKKPEKVKLYPILANIYLLEHRRDEKALKIFEMILKLNILTPKRPEINTIVANHYLTEGRKDGNAIAIMEQELNNKLRNF